MKTLFFFKTAILILLIVSYSCTDDRIIEQEIGEETLTQTRSLSIDDNSLRNPNLHTNWQNVSKIILNNGAEVDAPWIYREGNSNDIPLSYRTDIKKEDGWKMMSHTILNRSSVDPNYILLYNPKTAILKGFYFNLNPFNNNSFLWVLEANTPTSVLPLNTLIQGILNEKSKFATTSNIIGSNANSFAQLNAGWNAFSFELPYGTSDNNPILSIKGYNHQSSSIIGSGNYSGEVIIPVAGAANAFASIMSALKDVAGITSTFLPQVSTIEKALSVSATVFGYTSLYKSSSSSLRATSSGKITLEATSFSTLSGAVYSLNDITLKRLNTNNDLGLWTLSKTPCYQYNKYNGASVEVGTGNYTSYINMKEKESISNLIVINPTINKDIANYKVVNTQVFAIFEGPGSFRDYTYTKVNENIFHADNTIKGRSDYIPTSGNFRQKFYVMHEIRQKFYLNVTVEFTFKDGSSFISSRNFNLVLEQVNNNSILDGANVYVIG